MRLNDIFDRVVLINLDRRTDRLEEFDAQAKELGIQYERFSAINAEELGVRGITACSMSHTEVLKKAIADGVKRLFVFEDDASFVDDFWEKFEKVWSQVPDDWDIFYGGLWLHSYKEFGDGIVKPIDSYSAHAYGINTHAMEGVYQTISRNWHVDLDLSHLHTRKNVYCAKPALVYQRPGWSDLDLEFRDVRDKYV